LFIAQEEYNLRRRRSASKREDLYFSNVLRKSVYPLFNSETPSKGECLSEGSIINVRVTGLDEMGRGVAYYKGYKILIDDVLPGSEVVCKVLKVVNNVAYAKALKSS
jgi:predicted RNA-binding protein with TRAM domain